ncbi:MAG: PilZ domain-containing protein [Candidatus Omnitrophica bacterium]|nr:PilZ domain-containing protein [Candidatus Omnitrophota bacterium]MBU1933114.1 PilZ domain-containing protein [Candidatus Omnitrophota bacterium]
MNEKRKSVRLNLPTKVESRLLKENSITASSCLGTDISAGGMRLRVKRRIEALSPLGLRVYLPDEWQPILVEGEIAWFRAIADREEGDLQGDYEAGVRFSEISGFDRSRIVRLVTMEMERQRSCDTSPLSRITRVELEDKEEMLLLVKKGIGTIEQGLRIIDEKINLKEGGMLDLLGLDSSGQLVIIKLTIEENESMLIEALKHYDWILRNVSLLGRIYREDIDFKQNPKIILIGPLFSEFFKRQISYIKPLKIEVFDYYCLSIDGQKALFFENKETKRESFNRQEWAEDLSFTDEQRSVSLDSEEIAGIDEQHKKIVRWLWKRR